MSLTERVDVLDGSTLCEEADRRFRADTGLRTMVVRTCTGILYLVDRGAFDDLMVARLGYGRTLFARRPLEEVFPPSPPLILSSRTTVQEAYTTIFASSADYSYLDVLVQDADTSDMFLLPVARLLQQTSRVYAHLAQHDHLTGLPNRALLAEQLARSLDQATGAPAVALLFIDLDRFKVINDSLGHDAGDALLCEVAVRLRRAIRPSDLAARLGGDEFAVLLRDVANTEAAVMVAERIRSLLEQPFDLRGRPAVTTGSLGLALADRRSDAASLMREADTAMYESKRAGGNRVEVFHTALGTAARARFDTEAELHRAIECGELVAYYQPVVALADLAVVGFEALVRWTHPALGVLPPGQFLPVAQEAGLLPSIDRQILAQVVELVRREAAGQRRLAHAIHVNVSAQWLQEPRFVRDVVELIQSATIDPTTICLELTEEGFIGSGPTTRQSLSMLRELGVRVAIDDFGTGYSSLDQVSRLEFDVLKLDKRFVGQLRGGRRDRTIMRCLLDLADGLEVMAVAEGIETETQAAELQQMGCRYGQGYLYAKPAAQPVWQIRTLQAPIPEALPVR